MTMTVGELVAYIDVEDSKFNRGIDAAERKFAGAGDRISKIGTKIGGVLTMAAKGGVLTLGAGLAAGAVAGFKFNSSIEQTTIAMGTMLGSTKAATSLIAEVTKMASATPFEFPELADATKRLVAYGVAAKDAVPLMTRLGDISSALQIPIGELADIYGKMKVSGRITMEDMNQLAGRGIPIYSALAGVLGVSSDKIRGLVEAGEVGFPEIEKAFEKITDGGSMFGGMMDKQSRSFAGLWSTIKDSLTQVFATAVKPLFTWLSETGMPALIKAMPKVQAAVTEGMGAIGSWISEHKESIFNFFGNLKSFLSWCVDNKEVVVIAVSAIFGAMTGPLGQIAAGVTAMIALRKELEKLAGIKVDTGLTKLLNDKEGWGQGGPWSDANKTIRALEETLTRTSTRVIPATITSLDGARDAMARLADARLKVKALQSSGVFSKAEANTVLATIDKLEKGTRTKWLQFSKTAGDAGTSGSQKLRAPFKNSVGFPSISGAAAEGAQAGSDAREAARKKLAKAIAMEIAANVTLNIGGGTGAGLGDSFSSALGGVRAAQFATAQIGDAYRVGATGPDVWDCSGLAMGAYRAAGLKNFPTYTGNQWVLGRQIPKSQVRAGDQIFMKTGIPQWTDQFGWGHTGVAVGGGMMVHASGSRTGVIKSPIGAGYPWAARRQLAKGGLVKAQPGGVPALLGEAGKDELVISNLRRSTVGGSGDVVVEITTGDIYAGSESEAAESLDYITQEVTRRLVPAIRATQRTAS